MSDHNDSGNSNGDSNLQNEVETRSTTSESGSTEPRVYLVLGGSGGIGSRVVQQLCSLGAIVHATGRDTARLRQLQKEYGAKTHRLEVEDTGSIDSCVREVIEDDGRLDGVVNCIGSLLLKPIHLTSDDEWQSIIDVNLKSSFLALRAGVCSMIRRGGSIVLVSSAAARLGLPSHDAIAAAKAGVVGLMQSAAASYARRGIRVNCVAPGLVETQLTRAIVHNETARLASQSMHALGRLGKPDDISSMIVWLLSDEASWVTGQNFGVDGGLAGVRTKPYA